MHVESIVRWIFTCRSHIRINSHNQWRMDDVRQRRKRERERENVCFVFRQLPVAICENAAFEPLRAARMEKHVIMTICRKLLMPRRKRGKMRRGHFEARDSAVTVKSERWTSEWENACMRDRNFVCLYVRTRARACMCEGKREKVLESLRIKLIFIRINFNLWLNSSPQLKVNGKKETNANEKTGKEMREVRARRSLFRRALLNERDQWSINSPPYSAPPHSLSSCLVFSFFFLDFSRIVMLIGPEYRVCIYCYTCAITSRSLKLIRLLTNDPNFIV